MNDVQAEVVSEEEKGKTVRAGDDKIYLIKEGKRMWIRNPETLHELGFEFGQEIDITPKELYEYEDGGSIDFKENKDTGVREITHTEAHKPTPILNYRRSA